jgi:nicotinamide riboside kinase
MPEYGRDYDAYYRQGVDWCESDFIALAETHRAMRKAMANNANPLIIEDTDAVQTAVWAEMLLGRPPKELGAFISDTDLADLYILLSPDPIWINDGTRYSGDEAIRNWFFNACKQYLLGVGATFVEVSGTNWQTRTETATSLVIEWLM